jgi:hypothetical protein
MDGPTRDREQRPQIGGSIEEPAQPPPRMKRPRVFTRGQAARNRRFDKPYLLLTSRTQVRKHRPQTSCRERRTPVANVRTRPRVPAPGDFTIESGCFRSEPGSENSWSERCGSMSRNSGVVLPPQKAINRHPDVFQARCEFRTAIHLSPPSACCDWPEHDECQRVENLLAGLPGSEQQRQQADDTGVGRPPDEQVQD